MPNVDTIERRTKKLEASTKHPYLMVWLEQDESPENKPVTPQPGQEVVYVQWSGGERK